MHGFKGVNAQASEQASKQASKQPAAGTFQCFGASMHANMDQRSKLTHTKNEVRSSRQACRHMQVHSQAGACNCKHANWQIQTRSCLPIITVQPQGPQCLNYQGAYGTG